MNPPCPFPSIVPPLSCQLSSSMYFPLHRLSFVLPASLSVHLHRTSVILPAFLFPVRSLTSSPPPPRCFVSFPLPSPALTSPLRCLASFPLSCPFPYIVHPLSFQLSSSLSVPLHCHSVVLPAFLFPVRSFASSFRCLVCFPLPCPSPYIVPPLYCQLPSSLSVPLHRPSVVLSAFLSPVRSLTSSLRYIASFPLPCPFPYIVPLLSCTLPSSLSVLFQYIAPPLCCQLSSSLSVPLHCHSVVLPAFLFPVRSFASSFRCLICFPLPCPSPYIVPPLYCQLSSSLCIPLHRPSVVLQASLFPVRSLTSSLRCLVGLPLPCPFPYIVPPLYCQLSSPLSVPLHRPSVVFHASLFPVRSLTSSLRCLVRFPLPCPFPYIVPRLSCQLSPLVRSLSIHRTSFVLPAFLFPVRSVASSLRCLASFPLSCPFPYIVLPLSCQLSSFMSVPLHRPSVILPAFLLIFLKRVSAFRFDALTNLHTLGYNHDAFLYIIT